MKKFVAILVSLALCAGVMAGCASQSTTNTPATTVAPAAAATEAPTAGSASEAVVYDDVMITIAVHTNGTNSIEYRMMEHLGELLSERSNGAVKTEIFGEGQLGDEAANAEQVATNAVQIATTGFSGMDKYIKSVNCWSVPYLFTSIDQVKASWDGEIGDAARKLFLDGGIIHAGNIYRGNRQLTSSKLVEKPEDLKGLSLRLPDTSAWITVWQSMGAVITPMASSELFQALQTGAVEAQENPISSIYSKGLWEVQDYIVMTNHLVDFLCVLESEEFYNSLNADTQALLDECVAECLDWAQDLGAAQEAELLADMESKGMTVVTVDESAFADAAQEGIKKLVSNWEDWVYDAAMIAAGK